MNPTQLSGSYRVDPIYIVSPIINHNCLNLKDKTKWHGRIEKVDFILTS